MNSKLRDFALISHTTLQPNDEFIEQLMKRRTGHGEAEKIAITMNRSPHIAYAWTDGAESIVSIFVRLDVFTIQEISFVDE